MGKRIRRNYDGSFKAKVVLEVLSENSVCLRKRHERLHLFYRQYKAGLFHDQELYISRQCELLAHQVTITSLVEKVPTRHEGQ